MALAILLASPLNLLALYPDSRMRDYVTKSRYDSLSAGTTNAVSKHVEHPRDTATRNVGGSGRIRRDRSPNENYT